MRNRNISIWYFFYWLKSIYSYYINIIYYIKQYIMIAVSTIAPVIQKELGSFFSTEAHWSNDLIRYINSAVRAITIARNFWYNQYNKKITIIEWTVKYEIPYQIETFFVKKWWVEVDFYDFQDYHRLNDKTKAIWIWENTLICEEPWEYELFYRGLPAPITDLTDLIEIPEHFYDIIIIKATYFGFMDIKVYDKANNKKAIFDWMIKSIATRSSNPQPTKIKRLNKSKNKIW